MGDTISNAKANNLFWLGRYVQRVYLILHFMRRYRDMMIDDDEHSNAYIRFCDKVGIENVYESNDHFLRNYLYDKTNPNSLITALVYAGDNGTLLREEIKSESLAYIQMSISHIERCSKDADIDELQMVTDSMLAFWGSIDERMSKGSSRTMLKAGKFLESFDLHVRFEYPQERILYLLDRFEKHAERERAIFDQILLFQLKRAVERPGFNKFKVLDLVSRLFVA